MITLSTASWIALGFVGLVAVLSLRGTVRVFGKGADNGWDNAVAYVVVSVFALIGIGYLAATSYVFLALAPLLLWTTQTLALRAIYEVRTLHAWLLGMVHALLTTTVVSTVAFATAAVAAYILYGRIISDPMILIRLLLRLIGFPIDV